MPQHPSRLRRPSRLMFTVLLAIPLALLALAPVAGRASAHPAIPASQAAAGAAGGPVGRATRLSGQTGQIGKSGSAAPDITLHYHSTIGAGMFELPYRMATDAQGDLYVSDITLDRVREFDANDNFVRDFGTGVNTANPGDFNGPEGIAVSGNSVFIADFGNHRIQEFNVGTGSYVTEFGDSNLVRPYGMALATNGDLYVVDEGLEGVAFFSTAGVYLGQFGSLGSGNGQFDFPTGIAASPLGSLYVTETVNHRVQQFDLSGTYLNQWGSTTFTTPDGIAVDRAGMVYVADRGTQVIYKVDAAGSLIGTYAAPPTTTFIPGTFAAPGDVAVRDLPNTPIQVMVSDQTANFGAVQRFDQVLNPQYHNFQSGWGNHGSGNGQFLAPWATVEDHAGNVYVTDSQNDRVEKFDQFGNFLLAFGSLGSGNGQFQGPTGIAISPDGTTLYVADDGNGRIDEFNTSGGYVGHVGTAGSGNGQLAGPQAIATDGSYLYVADTNNDRIEVFSTVDNSYAYQFGTPGTGTGQFSAPTGIAVDIARQELFVADTVNNNVQVFDTAGNYINSVVAAGGVNFNGPVGVFTDQRGDVYVADGQNNRIVEMDVNLTRTIAFGTAGGGNGEFNLAWGMSVSPTNGQIYVADLNNYRIQRFGSPWYKFDTVGNYRPSTKTFYLRNENTTGSADISVYMPYAQAGDIPVVGDWEGAGVDTVGLYRPSTARFLLQDGNFQKSAPDYVFTLGVAGDTPIVGDWNGQGSDGAGIFRPSNGILYLKNTLSTGVADYNLVLGKPGDIGIAGDWNGDGQDSPGVYRPGNQRFFVTNKVTNGVVFSDASAVLGLSGDVPFTGDWVYQGFSGIGVFRPSNGVTYEKNQIITGPADNNFIYGIAGDVPVAGQWVTPPNPLLAPPPHVSLGTRTSSAAPHPASGTPGPAGPGSAPVHTPSAAATPSSRRTRAAH